MPTSNTLKATQRRSASPSTSATESLFARLDVHELLPDGPDARRLGNARGDLYREWLALWRSLSPAERGPLMHPTWLAGWFAHRVPALEGDFRLLVARDDAGALVSVVPVRVERMARGCRLRVDCGFDSGTLVVPRGGVAALVAGIFRCRLSNAGKPRCLELSRVENRDALLQAGLALRSAELAPRSVIDLSRGYEQVASGWSRNFRRTLRRAGRRLEAHGAVALSNVSDPEQIGAALARFALVDGRSWKSDEGETVVGDLPLRRMLAMSLPEMARSGGAAVQILSAGGRDVAAQITIRVDDTLHVIKTSYDVEMQSAAPGKLLLDATLRRVAPSLGAVRVSLVTGLPWHRHWRPMDRRTDRVWLFAPRIRGWVGRLLDVPWKVNLKAALAALGLDPAHLAAAARAVGSRLVRSGSRDSAAGRRAGGEPAARPPSAG